MYRAPSDKKMLARVGSDPTSVARDENSRSELNGRHGTPKGAPNFKLVKAINIPLLL